jgi:MoxR-like ATPase
LPESQLDRFLMRIELGYPDARHERALLGEEDRRVVLGRTAPELDARSLLELQRSAAAVHTAGPLLDYVQQLVAATRSRRDIRLGLSPRAAQGLVRAARAWALLEGRDAVLPDDVQAVWTAVALHRLELREPALDNSTRVRVLRTVLESVPVPR